MKNPFLILFSLILIGCSTYDCVKSSGLNWSFINYADDEIDTIILSRYKKGENFTSLIDTFHVTPSNTVFTSHGDTLKMVIVQVNIMLQSDYDYRIEVLSTGQLFNITEITEPQQEGCKKWGGTKKMCVNSITSCNINGIMTGVTNEEIYLKK